MRIPETLPEAMTAAQRAAFDAVVAGPRGKMPAPMRAWIRVPELADRAQRLGAFALFEAKLPARLREIAILLTARHWTAQFEWYDHRRIALEAGLEPQIIEAIALGRWPVFPDERSEIVYIFSHTLLARRTVDAAVVSRAIALLGEAEVVELVGVLGYYGLVAMTLNVFDIDAPEGEPRLSPLSDD